jgi:hypothetical protein
MEPILDPPTTAAFRDALTALLESEVPFVVAGAFALNHHTGIWRNTKDLDVFTTPELALDVLKVLARAGFQTIVQEKHWLGKGLRDDAVVDVIWGGGNWATRVDEHWFEYSEPGRVAGIEVPIAPAQDIILSKAYVAGRERFDGADIVHLIRARGDRFDWEDLVRRFGDHWPLLLHYMVLYRFVYPEARDHAPIRIVRELAQKLGTEEEAADGLPFRGLLLDRYAYLHDLRHEGRPDPGEAVARRMGYDPANVRKRRALDAHALDSGQVYKNATPSEELARIESERRLAAEIERERGGARSRGGRGRKSNRADTERDVETGTSVDAKTSADAADSASAGE